MSLGCCGELGALESEPRGERLADRKVRNSCKRGATVKPPRPL